MIRRFLIAPCLLASLAGCHVYQANEVADPNAITLPQAFASVAEGLRSFRDGLEKDPKLELGIITCRVIVSFNVSASASSGDKLTATLAAPLKVVDIGVGGEHDTASAAARANTVVVELNSRNPQICGYYNSNVSYSYGSGGGASTDTSGSKNPSGGSGGTNPPSQNGNTTPAHGQTAGSHQ